MIIDALTKTLKINEFRTIFGFNCASTLALNHMATATTRNISNICKKPEPLIKMSIAAIEPKQLEAIIPSAA